MIRIISRLSVRRPLITLVVWLIVVGAGFGIGINVFERLVGDIGESPGSESNQAQQRLDDAAPRPGTVNAVISGQSLDDPALREGVAAALAEVRAVPGVAEVSEPLPSPETGEALLVQVTVDPGDGGRQAGQAAAERLRGIEDASVTVSGGPLSDEAYNDQAQADVLRAEMLSTPVVLILLLIVFGGLLAAGLPLLIAGVGVGGTFGILYAFSTISDVSVYAIQVTTMLAVGLAVDYALLVVSRFREERRTAPDVATAVARTTATAGRTVMFSGLTVAVALAGLVIFPDPFLRSMGLAGAAVVLVDMAAALTLLPALLTRFGHRISPAKPRTSGGAFTRIARGVQRLPVLTLVVTAGAMVTLAIPVLDMQISEGDARMLPASTETRQLWDELSTHFPDRVGPNDILVVAGTAADDPQLARVRGEVAALPAITGVEVEQVGPELTLLRAAQNLPDESTAARNTLTEIRELPAPFDVEVTGRTARLVDYQAMLTQWLPWAIAVVVLGTLLLLFLFTGSLLVPIKAVLTNLLSIGAALGIVVWVFQHGNLAGLVGAEGLGYLNLTVPVLVGAIAFGLSVDYEVFLLSRIRERWLAGDNPRTAVAEGLQRSGRIVTAAALVIAVVFAGFIFGGFAPIKAIGLGLVLAILLDATIVRVLLVPATMTLLGRYNWWLPPTLQRVHTRLALSEAEPKTPARLSPSEDPDVAGTAVPEQTTTR